MIDKKEQLTKLLFPAKGMPELADSPAIIETDVDTPGTSGKTHKTYTYRQIEALVDGAYENLKEQRVAKGDRVMIAAPNSARMFGTILAIWRLGAVAVPVDVRVTGAELQNVARRLKAKILAGSVRNVPEFLQQHSALESEGIKLVDISAFPEKAKNGNALGYGDEIDLEAPAFIILTSGTTGVPKGAVHDLGSFMVNIVDIGEMAGVLKGERGLLPLPLSHIFGLGVTLVCFAFGASVIFCDMSADGFFACINKYDPNILVGVPTIYGAMLSLPEGAVSLKSAHLLLSGGAPLPISMAEDFEKRFGKKINNGYGSTESKIIALNLNGPTECVGRPIPSVTVEIIGENDQVLAEGETGEITMSGSNNMIGYVDNPEATEKVLRNGRYYTGDLGHLKDNQIFISGRAKEMIVVAGNKVFPIEVESVLLKHENAKEVGVVGVPHKALGQTVKAFIVINDVRLSKMLTAGGDEKKSAREELISEFKNYSKENLKRELRPMEWDFRPVDKPLPKTLSGKLDKKQLEV